MIGKFAAVAVALAWIGPPQEKKELEVRPDRVWTDTGMDVKPGDLVRISAKGTMQYTGAAPCGPEGLARSWKDLLRQLPVNDSGRGALVGRIGDSDAVRPFLIGPNTERRSVTAGRLFLGLNQMASDSATGSYKVTVERIAATEGASKKSAAVVPLTRAQLDSIPRRVTDPEGAEGDRVNFVVVGSEDKVREALRTAGWVTVDRSNKDAVIRGIFASLSKQAYVTLPMSSLTLFGRVQDYGYAQGDPVRVVASRHHFRLWKAPFTVGGQTVWAGAGTHDIGFDRDQRNNSITHKIDPDTDKEREYIGQSLQSSGLVVKLDYMTPADPVKTAKTAHGEEFFSDGRTLIVYLEPEVGNPAVQFAEIFCSVLKQSNPDGGEWGGCENYIDGAASSPKALGPISSKYRVEIVPGLMSSCFSDSPAFLEGQTALREKYGITAELIPVPNDASEDNAKVIVKALREKAATDKRKVILVGYSKGAPDLQVALAQDPELSSIVAAVVSVAGAVGGSPIADSLPAVADRWINRYNLPGCRGDLAAGFKSLQRTARQAFLASHPSLPVPAYSIAARSDQANTSRSLMQTWQLLATFSSAQDGQLLREDVILPGSKALGTVIGDHFAVALPFDKSKDSAIRAGMDKNKFPRAALLEAIVRFVTQDLEAAPATASR